MSEGSPSTGRCHDELYTLCCMGHRNQVAAVDQKVHVLWRRDQGVMHPVNSENPGVTWAESLPLENGSTHSPNEGSLNVRKHSSQLRGNLPRRKPQPLDWGNLSQWVKNREQGADLLFVDSTANQVHAGDLPDLGDLAGDHAAQGRADQSIPILDVA